MAVANVKFFQDEGQEWRFRVQAANGEIVSTSEGYTRKADARRGFNDAAMAFRAAWLQIHAESRDNDGEEPDEKDDGSGSGSDASTADGGAG